MVKKEITISTEIGKLLQIIRGCDKYRCIMQDELYYSKLLFIDDENEEIKIINLIMQRNQLERK